MFEELEMDRASLYLALAKENLYDCICSKKNVTGKNWEKKIAEIHLELIQKQFLFYEPVVAFTKSMINESLVCSKKKLGVRRCYVYVARLIVANGSKSDKMKFSSKGLNRWWSYGKTQESIRRSNQLDFNKQRI